MGALAGTAVLASLTAARPAAAGNGQGNQGGNQGGNSQGHCFLKGTKIRTAKGDKKVEDLLRGDFVPTMFAGLCSIQWIGHFSLMNSDPAKAWVKKALPVRIAQSALGLNVPCADLYVTQEHALLIDGVLVTAGSLINGTTITVYDPRDLDELEFFHVKLEYHNVIFAEGAACETLRNAEEAAVDFAGHSMTQEAPCAPLLSCTGARREIRSRFRSAISPWIDRRQKLDIIRDELEERGIAVS
jgi:hypothetical protein